MKRRSEDEKIRIRHALDHMRSVADAVEKALKYSAPLGADLAQTVETAALNVSRGIVKHDAFLLAEQDAADDRQRAMVLEELANPDAVLR